VSEDPRLELYKISYNVAMKSFLFGYGSKKASQELIKEQKKIGKEVQYNNSHNQFLDYFISGGLLMLVISVIIFFNIARFFLIRKNYIGFIFILFFLFQFTTEALMMRYRGIILFAIFTSLFYSCNHNFEQKKTITLES
jgi:O-antigen ligase